MKVYVVFPDNGSDPIAAFASRNDAVECCELLDFGSGSLRYVADLEVFDTLEEFMMTGKKP